MDTGFDLDVRPDDRTDDSLRGFVGPLGKARDADRADQSVIVVTLCACLLIATMGIIGLMAMGVNVAKEVSLAVAAQWGALLGAFLKLRRNK